ncbi:MAG TPA: D-isomer specific 2-hydroxyacid dehydrogenase family protein [Naasia sp.]
MSRFAHRAVAGASVARLPEDRRPEVGPIALLPEQEASPVFVEAVRAAGGEAATLSADTRGIVWLSNSEPEMLLEALEVAPGTSWVQLPWAGVDSFSDALRSADREGRVWTSAKGAYAQPVAEHALALVLAGMRSFPERVRASSWGAKKGESLFGRNVVIVGAGGIAVQLLQLLEPFGSETTVVRRSAGEVPGATWTVAVDRLDEVLPDADVVVLAAAATDETRHLLDARRLAMLKPTAVLVNIARGSLIDTEALVAALREERLLFAGLDVTDPEPLPDGHPLWTEVRALITPHSADTPEMIEPLLAERVRQNVEAFLSTGDFVGIVDPRAGY